MSYLGGTRVGRTVTPRNILMRSGDELHLPGPLVLDGGTATYRRSVDGKNTNYTNELRRGWIMAQVTASKKWVPCKRTAVAAGGSGSGSGAGSATVAVVNSAAFIVGEICTIPVTGGQTTPITRTISSIDYTNDLITFSGADFQVNTGAEIYVSTFSDGTTSAAGCEIPRAILDQDVWTNDLQDPVNAAAGTLYDKPIVLLCKGYLNEDYILGDFATCRATATNYLGGFLWADRQQGN